MTLFTVICFRLLKSEYSFSQQFEAGQQGDLLIMIRSMLLLGVLVGIHYLLTFTSFGVIIYVAALLIINILAWKFGFNV